MRGIITFNRDPTYRKQMQIKSEDKESQMNVEEYIPKYWIVKMASVT
jgi:hypothetical protein